ESLRARPDSCWLDVVPQVPTGGCEALALGAAASLLVVDLHPVRLPARAFREVTYLRVRDVARDVHAVHLRVGRGPTAAGALLEIVGDIHLARPALVLRFGRPVAGRPRLGRHRHSP